MDKPINIFNDVKIIGKGSCFSTGYKCTSFYFSLNSTCYLFECSYDTFQYIKTHIDEFKQYKQFVIAISHIHEDHVGGLGSFLYWLKYAMNRKRVTVVAPNESKIKSYISLVAPSAFDDFSVSIVKNLKATQYNPIYIFSILTSHEKNMTCCGYLVGYSIKKSDIDLQFYYTGDSDSFINTTTNLFNPPQKISDLLNSNQIHGLIAEVSLNESCVHTCFDEYKKTISDLSRVKFVHFNSKAEESAINKQIHH